MNYYLRKVTLVKLLYLYICMHAYTYIEHIWNRWVCLSSRKEFFGYMPRNDIVGTYDRFISEFF